MITIASTSSSSSSESSRSHKKGGSKSGGSRQLCEEFLEVPYALIPHYEELVQRPLSLWIMRDKLQRHLYTSMASFSRDFYEMLSNGRKVSNLAAQMIADTAALQQLFEKAKRETAAVTAEQPFHTADQSGYIVSYSETAVGNLRRTINTNTFLCTHCSHKVRNQFFSFH